MLQLGYSFLRRPSLLSLWTQCPSPGVTLQRLLIMLAALAVSGSAFAADMAATIPVKALPPVVAPAYNWTGFYVGGNVGYGVGVNTGNGYTSFTDPFLGFNIPAFFAGGGNVLPGTNPSGAIGGGQIGYDWQVSPVWVLGIVTDIQASGIKGSASAAAPPASLCCGASATEFNSAETNWFGTVRGKVGYAINNLLIYGTGGLAYGKVSASTSLLCPGCAAAFLNFGGSTSSTRTGWTAGGGVEYGLTANWTFGVEYLYVDLGTISVTETQTGGAPFFGAVTWTLKSKFADDMGRFVLNYKFN
jgi:outer membrane immunogenic protein